MIMHGSRVINVSINFTFHLSLLIKFVWMSVAFNTNITTQNVGHYINSYTFLQSHRYQAKFALVLKQVAALL